MRHLLFLFFTLTILVHHLHAQDSLRPKKHFVLRSDVGDGYSKHRLIPGYSLSAGMDQYFSAAVGVHLSYIRTRPGFRMGHWRHFTFTFDYKWNYYFTKKLLLREDYSLSFFRVYNGFLYLGPWMNYEIRFSRITDLSRNDLFLTPLIGLTQRGVIDIKAGYRFQVRKEEGTVLKNALVVEVICRPLMKNHPGSRWRRRNRDSEGQQQLQ